MKKILLLYFTLCILFPTHRDAFSQTTFQKTYGGGLSELANFIIQTADGGYAVCGLRSIPFYYADGYLLRLSASGDTIWTNMSIGPSDVTAYSVVQTSDQGYVIAGFYDDGLNLGRDVYLEKRDSSGNVIWLYRYVGSMIDEGYSMQETSDGGFIVAGMTRSFGSGGADMYLVRTDNSGNLLWTKAFGHAGNDYAYSVKQLNDGGFIISGKASVGAGGTDMMLVRTDSTGNILWAKTYGTAANEDGYSIELTNDGGYIIAGSTGASSGYSDVLLVKTDSTGAVQWSTTFTSQLHDYGRSVRQTSDGGYIVAGYTDNTGINSSDVYAIKTDGSGTMLWAKQYGMVSWGELGYCVQQTNDGGYIFSGFANTSANGYDVYLVKTDSQGNSGCNEAVAGTWVVPVTLQVAADSLSVSSGGAMAVSTPQISSEGTFATLCLVTGSNEEVVAQNQISIYPNPSSGLVTLSFNDYITEAGDKILFTDFLGQTLNVFELDPGQRKLEIYFDKGNNPGGIYLVTLISKSGTIVRKVAGLN